MPRFQSASRKADAKPAAGAGHRGRIIVNSIIYLVGLVVIVLAILSLLGLH